MSYSQTGWSQRCPCQPGKHWQVLGWSPHPPWTHPGIGLHWSQLDPCHPLWQLDHKNGCFIKANGLVLFPWVFTQRYKEALIILILGTLSVIFIGSSIEKGGHKILYLLPLRNLQRHVWITSHDFLSLPSLFTILICVILRFEKYYIII